MYLQMRCSQRAQHGGQALLAVSAEAMDFAEGQAAREAVHARLQVGHQVRLALQYVLLETATGNTHEENLHQ
jgi:hypothetical protein